MPRSQSNGKGIPYSHTWKFRSIYFLSMPKRHTHVLSHSWKSSVIASGLMAKFSCEYGEAVQRVVTTTDLCNYFRPTRSTPSWCPLQACIIDISAKRRQDTQYIPVGSLLGLTTTKMLSACTVGLPWHQLSPEQVGQYIDAVTVAVS